MKHKHAEVIKAWADGAEIEYWSNYEGRWILLNMESPGWELGFKYRVKPTPKPDVVKNVICWFTNQILFESESECGQNLRLTFDGETGKLKAAEVIE